jgi:hypothetical protein
MKTRFTLEEIYAQQAAQHERDARLTWEEKVALIEKMQKAFPGGRWPGRAPAPAALNSPAAPCRG